MSGVIGIELSAEPISLNSANPERTEDFDVQAAAEGCGEGVAGDDARRRARNTHGLKAGRSAELVGPVNDADERVGEGNHAGNSVNGDLRPKERGRLPFLISQGRSVLLADAGDQAEPRSYAALNGSVPAVQVEARAGEAGAAILLGANQRVSAKERHARDELCPQRWRQAEKQKSSRQ